MQTALIVAGAVVVLTLVWVIANFNRMVGLRQHIEESWSDIDVELQRRYSLIPNLVETVRGYANHERATLEQLADLRSRAMANHGSAQSQAADESAMLLGLEQVFALVEGYPQLKADAHFLELQNELALTEDRIAAARRFYNGNVRDLRQLCEMFPTSLLAGALKIRPPTYFELDAAVEHVVPKVAV